VLAIKVIKTPAIISIKNKASIGEKSIIAIGGIILRHVRKKGSVTSETKKVNLFGRVGIHDRIILKKTKNEYRSANVRTKNISCDFMPIVSKVIQLYI